LQQVNFNQLYYFYIVAREGSIKAATLKLHVTQPTISNQIRILEESLGYKLFERKHRKLLLNLKGEALLKRAEKIFVLADEMIREAKEGKSKERSIIKIGVLPSLPNLFIHDFSLKLWKDPNVAVEIIHGSMEYLIELLDRDRLDIILSDAAYLRSQKRYRNFNLGSQKIIAVADPSMTALKKNFPHSLNDQPYVAFSKKSSLQEEVDYFFKLKGIVPDRVGEVDDIGLMRHLAIRRKCFALLPYDSVKDAIKRKELIKLGTFEKVESNMWLVTSKQSGENVAIRKTINAYLQRK